MTAPHEVRPTLTTEAGAPLADNQNTETAGPGGPLLFQDQHLFEKLAHFNRERIPERIVHARGGGAYGTFTLTRDVSQRCGRTRTTRRSRSASWELNRNPDNIFAEVEQAIFSPAYFVPGIGPSPDKMLQGRLSAYADAHRYRVGVNADQLPVNRPHATDANAYHRDGALYDGRHRRAKKYEPNSFGGPVQTDRPLWFATEVSILTGNHPALEHAEDNDFVQPGNLYRLMAEDEKDRLITNLSNAIAGVSADRDDIVERAIDNFRQADIDFGKRLEAAVKERRGLP
ncbi:MAG: catalase [Actinomycetia bacterium]|nr:catalase [Actinomycetes bacterium]